MSHKMIIKYWPNRQSINLNNALVDLFIETEKKLALKTNNKSQEYLYLDILNNITRTKLLQSTLNEFKELILDMIEVNLDPKVLIKLNKQIVTIFINRVSSNFFLKFQFNCEMSNNNNLKYNYNNLTDYLLIYLIFGSSHIENDIFLFETMYTPYNHVKVLLENFIIQVGNIIIQQLIYNLNNSLNINKFLKKQNICNKLYTSNRSIILFLNNLKWQDLIQSYIYDIKSFYNERQKVWIISSEGIISKYIYLSKGKKVQSLNQIKITFLFWLEFKDLLIPKAEKFFIQIAKYFLYCSINLFSNLILILIRIIVFYLSK
uniref:hypothetical protein n=1 Tax=Symphyocladia marchantioides TaxID=88360 RepID=UPI0022FDA89A|nr:hypothetical protein PNW48_pgp180 [Symphyocladia marchantioides]WAX03791.1 hypothetical protein [Symphyocladia marchantioides]